MSAEEGFIYSDEDYTGFVPAVIARSAEEAEQYCELLNDHDIPSLVGNDEIDLDEKNSPKIAHGGEITHGVPVLVPEAMLDEASEVIADREDLDEFSLGDDEDEIEDDDDKYGFGDNLDSDLDDDAGDDGEDLSFGK